MRRPRSGHRLPSARSRPPLGHVNGTPAPTPRPSCCPQATLMALEKQAEKQGVKALQRVGFKLLVRLGRRRPALRSALRCVVPRQPWPAWAWLLGAGNLHAVAMPPHASLPTPPQASQQPTLLLGSASGVLGAWRELEAVCARHPAWAAELAELAQPVLTGDELAAERVQLAAQRRQQQREEREAAAAAAAAAAGDAGGEDEADLWFAEVLGRPASGGGAPEARGGGGGGDAAEAAEGEAEQSSLGAFDSLARPVRPQLSRGLGGEAGGGRQRLSSACSEPGPSACPCPPLPACPPACCDPHTLLPPVARLLQWLDEDRLRARQLARLLDARRWQRLVSTHRAHTSPKPAGSPSPAAVLGTCLLRGGCYCLCSPLPSTPSCQPVAAAGYNPSMQPRRGARAASQAATTCTLAAQP